MQRLGIDPNSDHRRAGVRMRLRSLRARRRLARASGPTARYDPQPPRYNRYLNEQGLRRRQPVARLGQCGARRGQRARLRLGHAPRAQTGAREGRGFRDPLHDPARHGFHARGRRRAVVPASLLHQAALALYRAGALQRHVRRRTMFCPRCAREEERANPHPVYREFMDQRVSKTFSRDEVRGEVIPVYMGLIKQIDDQLGVLFGFMQERRPIREHDDRVHLRPWRLSGRPLDGREGPVPRAVGEGSADHLRSSPRSRRGARHGLRRTGRGDRPGADLLSRRLAASRREQSHRLEGRSLVPFLHGTSPADVARSSSSANTTIRLAAGGSTSSTSRRAMRACS